MTLPEFIYMKNQGWITDLIKMYTCYHAVFASSRKLNKYTSNGKLINALNYMTFLLQSLYQKHQTQDSGAKIETIWQNVWTFNCVFITFPANKDLPHGNLYNTKGLELTLNILFSLLCTTRNLCAYSSVFVF